MRPAPIVQGLQRLIADRLEVETGSRVPKKRPSAFVVLTATGGAGRNLVQADPTVLVECWADSEDVAWTIAADTYELIDSLPLQDDPLPFGAWVAAVELTQPVDNPDIASGTPRFQFVATLTAS